jgi:hypothetical protein
VRPNTRVQRTRSSASPPHSPLTRRPLGNGRFSAAIVAGLAAASFLLVASACGRLVPERPATVTVVAADSQGGVMPGITVALDAVGEPGHFEATTGAKGSATFTGLRAGSWKVSGPSFGTEPTRPVELSVAEGATATARLVVSTTIIDTVKVK